MNIFTDIVAIPLGFVMRLCYLLANNYGVAIILFTLLSKMILFPIALKNQKNSVLLVKMKPELDEVKQKFAAEKQKIGDEQLKIYDKYKYNPFIGCFPLLLQIPILLGLIKVIYNPLKYILGINTELITKLTDKAAQITNEKLGSLAQLRVVELIKNPTYANDFADICSKLHAQESYDQMLSLNLNFLGIDLIKTPSLSTFNMLLLIPLICLLSTLFLSIAQNKMNVLQREQGFWVQWGMTLFFSAFSTYFTFVVPAGVGLYWSMSNVFGVIQLITLNYIYDSKSLIK